MNLWYPLLHHGYGALASGLMSDQHPPTSCAADGVMERCDNVLYDLVVFLYGLLHALLEAFHVASMNKAH